jgi:acetamidase/formamidase
MCHIEAILEDMNETMEAVHKEIKGLAEVIENGIEQAEKGLAESGWVKLHITELVDTLREAHGLSKDSGS